jgi:deoxyribodipyrimidine photo-lyase
LRFGEVGPFQVWDRTHGHPAFQRQLGWREFSWNILYHSPALAESNFRPEYDRFSWGQPEPAELEAWQSGRTGIPLVDAGMRELWHTGYMHNRVRMVAASFLVKNLLVDWRVGEKWFWDTLVDADEANNPASWQWVAGSGADAAPYFRVFNPLLQAAKFDPESRYISRWVPDIGTPAYPDPIVDLAQSRRDALEAYAAFKRAGDRP